MLEVPDGVWDIENNASNETLRLSGRNPLSAIRQASPPSAACLNIKLIYNRRWVQSSASGNAALARQRALDVLAEAENIYNKKFSSNNQLGTSIKFNLVGGGNGDMF